MNKTVNINGRVRIQSLATCISYFINKGCPATSRSDVLWKAVEVVANNAIRVRDALEFRTVEEAVDFIKSTGLTLGVSDRSKRMIASALQEEVLDMDFGVTTNIPHRTLEMEYNSAKILANEMGLPVPTFEEFKEARRKNK